MSTLDRRALDELTERIIGAAIAVHRGLGPGLLESAYSVCLAHELTDQGLRVEREKALPLVYREVRLDCAYRLDLLVNGAIVVEVNGYPEESASERSLQSRRTLRSPLTSALSAVKGPSR